MNRRSGPPPARYRGAAVRALALINPMSGRGRGGAAGEAVVRALESAGHEATPVTIREWDAFQAAVPHSDIVVIVGGDGTVHRALEALMRGPGGGDAGSIPQARPALYHFPMGTENLLARQFGMTSDPARLARAVDRFAVREIDIGIADGRPFAIMASVGPDASVIHRVNLNRTGAVSRWSYARPVLLEAMRPTLPALSVVIERAGERTPLARAERGWLLVANMRQYAARIDPCAGAACEDGLLDAAFFPAGSTLELLRWVARARLRLTNTALARAAGARHAQADRIVVTSHTAAPVQFDGEVGAEMAPGAAGSLDFAVSPRALRVLVPPPERPG